MQCLERSEPVNLGCVLEKNEASWAIAHFLELCVLNSRLNARIGVWKTCSQV